MSLACAFAKRFLGAMLRGGRLHARDDLDPPHRSKFVTEAPHPRY